MTLICQLYWLAPLNHAPCFLSVSGPRLSYGCSLSVNCVTVLPWITHCIVEAAFFIRETSLGGTFSSLHQGSNRWSKTLHSLMIENSFAVSRRRSCWSSSAHQSCIFCPIIFSALPTLILMFWGAHICTLPSTSQTDNVSVIAQALDFHLSSQQNSPWSHNGIQLECGVSVFIFTPIWDVCIQYQTARWAWQVTCHNPTPHMERWIISCTRASSMIPIIWSHMIPCNIGFYRMIPSNIWFVSYDIM